MNNDPGWLVKDFNVLYRVTRELLMATGGGDETKVAHALNAVASQIERLKPAYEMTETVRVSGDVERMEAFIGQVQRAKVNPCMLFVSPEDECDEDPAVCDCSYHDNARRAAATHTDPPFRPCCGACGAEQIDGRTQVCLSCQSKWDGSEILPDRRRS